MKPFKWKWASLNLIWFILWHLLKPCFVICWFQFLDHFHLVQESLRLWRILLHEIRGIPSSVERRRIDVAVASTLSRPFSQFSFGLSFRGLPVHRTSVTTPCCSNQRTMLYIALSLGAFLTWLWCLYAHWVEIPDSRFWWNNWTIFVPSGIKNKLFSITNFQWL